MNTLNNRLKYGQSMWLDLLGHKIIDSEESKKLIEENGIRSLSSHPDAFESVYDETKREGSTVSLQVSSLLAHYAGGAIKQAKEL